MKKILSLLLITMLTLLAFVPNAISSEIKPDNSNKSYKIKEGKTKVLKSDLKNNPKVKIKVKDNKGKTYEIPGTVTHNIKGKYLKDGKEIIQVETLVAAEFSISSFGSTLYYDVSQKQDTYSDLVGYIRADWEYYMDQDQVAANRINQLTSWFQRDTTRFTAVNAYETISASGYCSENYGQDFHSEYWEATQYDPIWKSAADYLVSEKKYYYDSLEEFGTWHHIISSVGTPFGVNLYSEIYSPTQKMYDLHAYIELPRYQ